MYALISENITCHTFHNKLKQQAQFRLIFHQLFFVNWNMYKGLCVIEGCEGCIFYNELNEGHETKAAFQGSFTLRWPSVAHDDEGVELCSLTRKEAAFCLRNTPYICTLFTFCLFKNFTTFCQCKSTFKLNMYE